MSYNETRIQATRRQEAADSLARGTHRQAQATASLAAAEHKKANQLRRIADLLERLVEAGVDVDEIKDALNA